MKSKKSSAKISWKVWAVPIIVAVITGCFGIYNNLLTRTDKAESVQSVNEQNTDSGSINNYNAKGDINFNYGTTKDSVVKPPVKNADKKSSKSSNNTPQSTVTGNNNTVIQGNNNTVTQGN